MNTDPERLSLLAKTIERLRARITQHGEHIGDHETRTRVILIDPLLRSLGWETEEPASVVHEHSVGRQRVDYALKIQGTIFGILEAKALKSKLNDGALVKYVGQHPNVPVIAFTNGDEWRFFLKVNQYERETVKVSASLEGAFKIGFDLDQKIGRPGEPPPPPNGITLPKLLARMMAGEFPKGKKPTRVSFDGVPTELPKRTWKQMYATVASHLVATGRIHRGNVPIKRPKAKKPLVSLSKDGFNSAVDIGGGLWLEANVNATGAVDNSIFLLERCGVDPSTVRVHFD